MPSRPAIEPDQWLAAFRRAADRLGEALAAAPTTLERAVETGERGEGGDRTLMVDVAGEEAVFAQFDELHAAGLRFTAVSEERGEVDYGGGGVLVVVDPIDGSLNCKRGLPSHSVSLAVAEGPTMADVVVGFVHDFGPGEEWLAVRGAGAQLDGRPLDTAPRERRTGSGRLEIVGIESADPRWVAASIGELSERAHRLRAMGSIAISLCQVADARFDGMVSLRACRAVDAAAAQLVVRESGGHVAFPAFTPDLAAPLDLVPRSPVIAARTRAALAELAGVPA